jgi:hypothetical protein
LHYPSGKPHCLVKSHWLAMSEKFANGLNTPNLKNVALAVFCPEVGKNFESK